MCLRENFVQCSRKQFALAKVVNKLLAKRKRVYISMDQPSEVGKLQQFVTDSNVSIESLQNNLFINSFKHLTWLC